MSCTRWEVFHVRSVTSERRGHRAGDPGRMVRWLTRDEFRARYMVPKPPPRLCEQDGERLPHRHCRRCEVPLLPHRSEGPQRYYCSGACRAAYAREQEKARRERLGVVQLPAIRHAVCTECGAEITQYGTGRPIQYCSAS